eukprot:4692738-Pleurochrysis_carterae.AAC.2
MLPQDLASGVPDKKTVTVRNLRHCAVVRQLLPSLLTLTGTETCCLAPTAAHSTCGRKTKTATDVAADRNIVVENEPFRLIKQRNILRHRRVSRPLAVSCRFLVHDEGQAV